MRDANGIRRLLIAVAVIVPLAALVARGYAGGWFIIMLGAVYLAVAIYHAVIHIGIARRVAPLDGAAILKIVAAHAVLLIAFLLQWDVGDGPSWLTISALLAGGPGASRAEWMRLSLGAGALYDIALLVPVVLLDVMIKRRHA